MGDLDKSEQRQVIKEAMQQVLKEWLDEQWASFGKWSARGLLALVFSALMYLWFSSHGFKLPQ